MNIKLVPALVLALVTGAVSTPARAGDVQGDAYSCGELWEMRNQVFKDNGYCFKSAKAIKHFGNAGCQYDSEADVPVSDTDRSTIRDIKRSQVRQGC
ncbi:MAG: YARHG domain-containing protein [Hyphomicrobium sp.]